MDLQEQVIKFRALLQQNDLDVEDFELNVNSDAFKGLLDGGAGSLEVLYRKSGVSCEYQYDGTPSWLDLLSSDLESGKFQSSA